MKYQLRRTSIPMTDEKDFTQANDTKPEQPTRIPITFSNSTSSAGESPMNSQASRDVDDRAEILDRIKRIEVKEPTEGEEVDDLVKEYESRYFGFREKHR